MSNPFFSVVIPTYNRAGFIRKTVESVLAQQFTDFEIIIIDDGSTDNTEEVVKNLPGEKIRYHKSVNQERGAARNIGVRMSRGEYTTFLDSDDLFFPQHLATVHANLIKHNRPVFFHQAYTILDVQEQPVNWHQPDLASLPQSLLTIGNSMSCMGVFIRTTELKTFPFIEDRQMAGLEDWELWIRLAAHFPLVIGTETTSALIQHETRSVVAFDPKSLKHKVETFLHHATSVPAVVKQFGKYFNTLRANAYSFISLQLSTSSRGKWQALKLLTKAVRHDLGQLKRRRTWAIVRNLLRP